MSDKATALKEALRVGEAVVAPGVYDALTALLVQHAGFPCVYLSGGSIAYTRLGRPDMGLVTLTEVAQTLSLICERVDLPVIVDADTGFGNALNVQRSVALLEQAGAAAIQLEDQTLPKRCGHLAGKTLVSTGEMVGKLKAARDALRRDTLIIARTDAIAVEGLDSAMERARAYEQAGADVLFIEAPPDESAMLAICEEFAARVPLLANMVEGGRTPIRPVAELAQMGYRLVIFPGAMVRVLTRAATEYLDVLQRDGTTRALSERMFEFDKVNELVGLEELINAGERYAGDTD